MDNLGTTAGAGPSPDRLMHMAWGYAPVLIVDAAVRHGVFDALAERALSLPELVGVTGASRRGLEAIVNALVGLQLLSRKGTLYALTPESEAYLVAGRPGYRGGFFRHHTDQLLPQWLRLADAVKSGAPVAATNRQQDGARHFVAFVESLFPGNYPAARALGEHLQLSQARGPVSVLDLGAGSGVWGIALAEQSAWVHVLAVDWPEVLEVTRRVAARHGVEDRFMISPGDLFHADFGVGHQVAVLGHILHSEGPERIRRLLERTFSALAPGGVVAIQEFVPNDDRTGPALPLLFAVNMLVNTEAGGTYTFGELSAWLSEAGFVKVRQLGVPAVSPLVLADRPVGTPV